MESEFILLKRSLFYPTCVQPEIVNGKSLLDCLNLHLETNHDAFIEEIFWPPDSKSLRLRCAAFERPLS